MVPAGASGVRDYGRLLAAEFRRRDQPVDEVWVGNDGLRVGPTLAASARFLRAACAAPRGSSAVWHYSSFAYGLRGIPMPGILFGVILRSRGIRVLTVLHEPAYPWGRRGLRGRAQSLAQWLALPVVLAGSHAAVVTTEGRLRALRRIPARLRPDLHTTPVFSTVDVATPEPTAPSVRPGAGAGHLLGLLGWSGDGARPDLLLRALVDLGHGVATQGGGRADRSPAGGGARVVVLGSPGPASPEGVGIARLAAELGLADRVEFTGVVASDELSRRLQRCDIVLVLNEEGPSGRRTTIAVPLAHGMPMICLDGPHRWEALVPDDAVVLVRDDPASVAAAVTALLNDPSGRLALGERARRCHQARMGVGRTADLVTAALGRSPGPRAATAPAPPPHV